MISFTVAPQNMDMIGFFSNLLDCNMEFVIVRIAVKNTDMESTDKSGAALFTDSALFLKSILSIGCDNTDMPIAHGIDMTAANFNAAFIVFFSLSVLFSALADARAGVSADEIGTISADGRCDKVTASVL